MHGVSLVCYSPQSCSNYLRVSPWEAFQGGCRGAVAKVAVSLTEKLGHHGQYYRSEAQDTGISLKIQSSPSQKGDSDFNTSDEGIQSNISWVFSHLTPTTVIIPIL